MFIHATNIGFRLMALELVELSEVTTDGLLRVILRNSRGWTMLGTMERQESPGRQATARADNARRLRAFDPLPVSILLALVFTAAGLVELLTRGPVQAGQRADDELLIVLTVMSSLALALLWLTPLGSLCVSLVALCAQSLLGYDFTQAALWAVVVASFATVALDRWARAVAAGFLVAAGMIIVFFSALDVSWRDAASTWGMLSVAWVVAVVIRLYRGSVERAERRAALFAADREARAREAVAEERLRLARELHDSIGHALNVVVLHAGAARRVVDTKPDLAREALGSIESTGRQALADIERMLGILRASDATAELDAAPGLAHLDELCASVREAGLPVELTFEDGAPSLPASLDLTAYRIVQEALTNSLKHAGPRAHAWVRIRHSDGVLVIDVVDDGRGGSVDRFDGGGHGLAGMRERVVTFGGDLHAGPRPEGGFAIQARLPVHKEVT
ncbi:MAG: sensor histidine kinase [Thermoleophilia bacterium]